MTVLVLVEHQDGHPDELSLQALTLARGMAEADGPLEALLVGPGGTDAARELGAHGVTTAHVTEDDRLAAYAPAAWARCVTEVAASTGPSAVVAAGSNRGNEVMAHAAASMDLPFAANCTKASDDGSVTRVRWGGSLLEEARIHGSPLLLSCAPHAVQPTSVNGADAPEVRPLELELEAADLEVQVKERIEAETKGISLAEAKVVISGGRGVGSADGFGILEELAGLLNAAVGCSRVVTMAGWRPHTDQVGQTGTKVSPDLYIACGISGATQHIAGCKGAKKILAINSDAEAPILNNADYAVIGDLTEVVPAITEELKRERSG
jgi:electron transfer flavoprotein alpha subunit